MLSLACHAGDVQVGGLWIFPGPGTQKSGNRGTAVTQGD